MPIIDIIAGVKVYQEEKFSILFGCPPEIIKHFMVQKIPFPDYVVLPDTIHKRGVLQNATEFVLYYHVFVLQNYFKGKKLKILGEPQHVANNRELLRLTLLGPSQAEFNALDVGKTPNPIFKELYNEARALALKDKAGIEVSIDGFVDFFSFKNNVLETEEFSLKHRDKNIYEVNGHIIDLNFTEEQFPLYDL
ncbi:MAG: hypothetical protein GQ569_14445 [Methylococcaceae bacterium]|nr:hypothetical protein [Methylococcaceae bacterium]